jgi:hypothetical protein
MKRKDPRDARQELLSRALVKAREVCMHHGLNQVDADEVASNVVYALDRRRDETAIEDIEGFVVTTTVNAIKALRRTHRRAAERTVPFVETEQDLTDDDLGPLTPEEERFLQRWMQGVARQAIAAGLDDVQASAALFIAGVVACQRWPHKAVGGCKKAIDIVLVERDAESPRSDEARRKAVEGRVSRVLDEIAACWPDHTDLAPPAAFGEARRRAAAQRARRLDADRRRKAPPPGPTEDDVD